ncbi:UDP-N-acetylmuramoyl-tripeptide--D-alanyl-D-alanine ligase [Chitinophaga costaii]|uniref:UDP-N-acetylmuramoyl-tripeptide--D-alanyl-D-alanine ligase n=1 Tax=Chitinophaga costaii TaxID=1335309 RepID=A0A1C4DQM9_9BACT|nr:UDP-N-acetylmuramoyl-tripeptide--D-alanyl-D-alanine ligase [Chitinophaga costaii]SCC33649.1 UDP-N-acetylmuramoyl-tripeptide--D-alanyl-D-alanine ligase [Chitinophaga costaii]
MQNLSALYDRYRAHSSIQTDTRKLQPGDIFFALKGPHFNGNAYAEQALAAGAAYAVVDDPAFYTQPDKMMLVPDALQTLQRLANLHRRALDIPFLAITGTNGKTTTKELINAVLSSHFKTVATEGNLNNHIGVPLTLLKIPTGTEIAVIEMGANHQREIAGYCEVAMPTHGLITNIGKAHLEGFGGPEGVKIAKGELYDYLRAHEGTAFVCTDYDYLLPMAKGIPQIITYGGHDASYQGQAIAGSALLAVTLKGSDAPIQTHLVGAYNTANVLAAVAVGRHFGVPEASIRTALEGYVPSNNRSQVIQQGSNTIIMDAYNANPSSMRAAIENFAGLNAPKKVLLLGGMMELGADSIEEHQALVDLLQQTHWHAVVLVGGDFSKVKHPYLFLPDAAAAHQWLAQQQFQHTYLLIKGSRSVGMEKVL